MGGIEGKIDQAAGEAITVHTGNLWGKIVFVVVVIALAILVQRLLVRFAKKTFGSARMPSASIFLNLCRAFVWSIAFLAVLQPVFGVKPTAFVTALGVSSLVISLGMQDSISNIMGGLALMVSHVLSPGDIVNVSGISGEVLDISWRSTTVKDIQGNVQVIPNSVLNKSPLTHLAHGALYQVNVPLSVAKDADLQQVESDIKTSVRACLGKHVAASAAGAVKTDVQGRALSAVEKSLLPDSPASQVGSMLGDVGAIQISYTGISGSSVSANLRVYLTDDTDIVEATDKVVRSLVGKSWLN